MSDYQDVQDALGEVQKRVSRLRDGYLRLETALLECRSLAREPSGVSYPDRLDRIVEVVDEVLLRRVQTVETPVLDAPQKFEPHEVRFHRTFADGLGSFWASCQNCPWARSVDGVVQGPPMLQEWARLHVWESRWNPALNEGKEALRGS